MQFVWQISWVFCQKFRSAALGKELLTFHTPAATGKAKALLELNLAGEVKGNRKASKSTAGKANARGNAGPLRNEEGACRQGTRRRQSY